MSVTIQTFFIDDLAIFKQKALIWANKFALCAYLDSNKYSHDVYRTYECLIGVAKMEKTEGEETLQNKLLFLKNEKNSFERLKTFYELHKDWLFGFLTYDLKNEIEDLQSDNWDGIGMPDLCFFHPDVLIIVKERLDEVCIQITNNYSLTPADVFQKITQEGILEKKPPSAAVADNSSNIQKRISKKVYLEKVAALRQHILEGDAYEMNLCQEFYLENININPISTFNSLNKLTQAPFAAYLKIQEQYLLCASPERFLKKRGHKLISQPIKGTIRRDEERKNDRRLKRQLFNDPKERAENVMIVDLVRNDLTRSAKFGTIVVEELFGTYSFKTVHHLISTITAQLREGVHFVDAIKNAFPMGSMTGAPKVMAMQLIEQYEETKRGLYSGAVGYISPDGNFDFNVVIRSLLYDVRKRYVSMQVGGAITFGSVAEKEYEECLLKAQALLEVL